jgi:hypothetical protein
MESSEPLNSIKCETIYVVDKPRKEERDARLRIGGLTVLDASVKNSSATTKARFLKPSCECPSWRESYDSGAARKNAIDKAFAGGITVKDPYTGAELVEKQSDAIFRFGSKWQNHAAEADHIEPLNQFVTRANKNPFVPTEDACQIVNSEDNLQVMARSLNQNNNNTGKGACTQEQWANNPTKMKGVEELIEDGRSITEVQEQIKEVGKRAERVNSRKLLKTSVKNALYTFHDAGLQGAKYAGATTLTISGISNLSMVVKGEKSGKEATIDTLKDGATSAATGYVLCGGLTVLYQSLSGSDSKAVQFLIEHNVPGKAIAVVLVTGDVIKKWKSGDITTQECLIQLGDRGLNMTTMPVYMAAGQALIPIPIVGGAIGGLVGSALTSGIYNKCVEKILVKFNEKEECVLMPA